MLVGKYMDDYSSSGNSSGSGGGGRGSSAYQTYVPPGWSNWFALQTLDFFVRLIDLRVHFGFAVDCTDACMVCWHSWHSLFWVWVLPLECTPVHTILHNLFFLDCCFVQRADAGGGGLHFPVLSLQGPRINANGKSTKYPDTAYQTDVLSDIAVGWLENSWEPSNPFFMLVCPHAPHAPYTPAPRHKGTLAGLVQPPDPALNETDSEQSTLPGAIGKLPQVDVAAYDSIFQARAEALLGVDDLVGALVDELDKQSVLDKTWIFYTSVRTSLF